MRICILLIVLLSASQSFAQRTSADWTNHVAAGLNLSEASYTDWAAGGENALAYVASLVGVSIDSAPSAIWTNSYRLAFGQARISSQGLRKTDDDIFLESLIAYRMSEELAPYGSLDFKTQFAPGYKYDDQGLATQVSNFFDPAYIREAAGIIYTPGKAFNTRFGLALREIITNQYTQYAAEASGEMEKINVQGGFESVSKLILPIDDNLLLTSTLELFAPMKSLNVIVLHSDNALVAKVSKYINVNLTASFINDKVVTPRTQIKQGLAIGLNYTLL